MKKLLTLTAVTALLVASLTGCGTKSTKDSNDKVIKVAASATPHAEILEAAKDKLQEKGYELKVEVFDDYILPNQVVTSGECDANYFQHVLYLEDYNKDNKTDLTIAGKIHYEPFGIYAGKKSDLAELTQGDVIAIPNDTTNEARALQLLQDKGIIKLKDGAGLQATINDIVENPYSVDFKELPAAQVPRVLGEVAFGVVNGNYALSANLTADDVVAYESSDSTVVKESYVNVIAVAKGNENSEKIQALVSVLKSDDIKTFIEDKYNGSVQFFQE